MARDPEWDYYCTVPGGEGVKADISAHIKRHRGLGHTKGCTSTAL